MYIRRVCEKMGLILLIGVCVCVCVCVCVGWVKVKKIYDHVVI